MESNLRPHEQIASIIEILTLFHFLLDLYVIEMERVGEDAMVALDP